jgi:hypothetical protein
MSFAISQAEADSLLRLEKHRTSDESVRLPDMGGSVTVPLASADGAENFHLDIYRGRINLAKGKFQNRARTIVILARVDIGGAPHRNPDDTEVPCPHIHLYREGFADRWAFSVTADQFSDTTDHWRTLIDFMRYCNITVPPRFERGLFT